MPRRTHTDDARHIDEADDLADLVVDKREGWRATAAKARRRQRRYSNSLTRELVRMARDGDDDLFEDDV